MKNALLNILYGTIGLAAIKVNESSERTMHWTARKLRRIDV